MDFDKAYWEEHLGEEFMFLINQDVSQEEKDQVVSRLLFQKMQISTMGYTFKLQAIIEDKK